MVVINIIQESIFLKGYRIGSLTRVLYCTSHSDLTNCYWRVFVDLQSLGRGVYRYTTKGNPLDQVFVILESQFPGNNFMIR